MKFATIAIASALLLSSCYKATIYLKAPQPVVVSPAVDDNFHFSAVGVFELSSPVNLQTGCPGGAAIIKERQSFLGGFVSAVIGTYIPLFQVMNPTLLCDMPRARKSQAAKAQARR